MQSIIWTVSAVLWRPIAKSLGGGLYHIKFVPVTRVAVMCVEPICLCRVKPMPLVRPSSPGLTWGTLPRVMFGLRRDRKSKAWYCYYPTLLSAYFCFGKLVFSCIVREKGLWSYSMVKTPWIQLYGLSCGYKYP